MCSLIVHNTLTFNNCTIIINILNYNVYFCLSFRLDEINDRISGCKEIKELLEINNQITYLLQHASEKSNKLFELFRPISDIDFTKKEENKNCMEK